MSKSGIYQILIGEKGYIGSTNNLTRRKQEHKTLLKTNKHCNQKLQNRYNKYKLFEFKILCECSVEDLDKLENQYIDNENFSSILNIKPAARGGFLSGENHKRAKICEKTALLVIDLVNQGFSGKEICEKLNLSNHIVYHIKGKKTWQHLSHLIKDQTDREKHFIDLCKKGYGIGHCMRTAGKILNMNKVFKENRPFDSYIMPYRKYTMNIVNQIREDYKNGVRICDLERNYNIDYNSIYAIISNRTYKI